MTRARTDDPATWRVPVVTALALLAALTVATYVPVPGATRAGATPCAAAAMVFTVMGAPALGTAGSSPFSGIPALILAALGLGQRLLGAAACPPRTP